MSDEIQHQLKIYNSFTQQKAPFEPITPGKIRLYVCGITVYDYCHIGHARVMVSFDVIVRYLRWIGFDVTYVRNITDVDDKIIERAKINQEDMTTLTERFIKAMHEDFGKLGILEPNKEPRATEYMPHIIKMVQTLLDKKHAYIGDNQDVYYAVDSYKPYGELSHRHLDELRAGERVEVVQSKHNPLDFVLWKKAKADEPSWSSDWGMGRPGWHIECSAMSTHCLGTSFDIHGGGMDLIFPHHENERAQSEASTGHKFVNTWMHVGFVQVNEEKMSKSLNNFFTIHEVLREYDAEVVRYFLMSSHYRSPINYSKDQLDAAKHSLERLYTALRGIEIEELQGFSPNDSGYRHYVKRFWDAMNDDFNVPIALSVLFDLVREMNTLRNQDPNSPIALSLGRCLKELAGVFGILERRPEEFLQGKGDGVSEAEIEHLIAARNAAREQRNFMLADQIRDELKASGITLEDTAKGTIWRRE